MSELLPCPFCGSPKVQMLLSSSNMYRVLCADCSGVGPPEVSSTTKNPKWNRRATDPAQQRGSVAGEYMQRSHADFERACEVAIGELVQQPNPPNHIVGLLCDAERVSRECCRLAQTGIASTNTAADPALERLKEAALAAWDDNGMPTGYSLPQPATLTDNLWQVLRAAEAYAESRKAKP